MNALAQKPLWVSQLAGTGEADVHVCRIAPNDNIYIAGSYTATLDIDPGAGAYNISSKGGKDIFLACYTPNGNLIWGISAGGPGNDLAENLAVDANNDPVIVGQITSQNIDFDPSPTYKYLHAKGGADGFLAKYTANGNYVWGTTFGGNSAHDNTLSVATDADLNIYVGGDFHEDMDIDPAPLSKNIVNSLTGTAYLVKYTPSGQLVWGFNFGAGGLAGIDNAVWAIASGNDGYIYIAGCFEGKNIDFDPSNSTANLSAAGGYDGFVAKYTEGGQYQFAAAISGVKVEQAFDIALDAAKDIYITGYTESSSVSFGNVVKPSTNANDKADVFLAKYSNAGLFQWGHIFGGNGTDVGWGIAVNKDKLYCTGYFRETMDADPGGGVENLSGNGQNELYLSKFELNGDFFCAFSIGGKQQDIGRKITFDKQDNLLMSGLFAGGDVDFDPFVSEYKLSAQGMDGFFVLYDWTNVYTPPAGYITGDTICSGRPAFIAFTATAGNAPFTISYTDGTNTYTENNLHSGVPFPVAKSPEKTTVYKLTKIKGAGLCSPIVAPNTPFTVLVYPSPWADAGADTNVCPGAVIQLHGSGNGTYEWYPAEGISEPSIADPLLFVGASTIRRIIVTNGYGCKDTNAVTIDIIPFDVKADSKKDLCIGDTLQLIASGADVYHWRNANDISDSLIGSPFVWPRHNQTYTVLVQDTVCNRQAELAVNVAVHSLPDIRIVTAKDIDCGLQAAKLAAIGGEKYNWWPPESLDNATSPQPVAMPVANTRYIVTGTDHNGCMNKDSADIEVFAGNGRLFTPNAFTPNNDGKNDCYRIKIPGDVTSFELSVYNRFGQMVFYTNDYDGCWDGSFKGVSQPLGTYYYYYKAHSTVCEDVFGKGDVLLVR